MEAFIIKQGDTSPLLDAELINPDGSYADITGATVVFSMKDASGTVKVNEASATILDAENGSVRYSWTADDTDTAGTFYGEFEVTFANSRIETFPNSGYIRIEIDAEVS